MSVGGRGERRMTGGSGAAGPRATLSRVDLALISCSLPSAVLATLLLLLPPFAFASLYGRLLYPAISAALEIMTSWTWLPLGLALLPTLVGITIFGWLLRRPRLPLPILALRLLLLAVLLWSSYLLTWGANYRRPALLDMLTVSAEPVEEAEMIELAREMVMWIAMNLPAEATSGGGHAPAAAGTMSDSEVASALASIASQLQQLAREVGWPARLPARVKWLPAGTLLGSGYAGMLFPFTLEPQVDSGLGRPSRVAVGAHELAHVAGFAAEADADLAAVLAGLRSTDRYARYAVSLSILARLQRALPAEERDAIRAALPPEALDDLAEARERSARYLRSSLAGGVSRFYDRLLRSQGVTGGVGDYGQLPRNAALLRRQGLLPQPPVPLPGAGQQ